MVGGCPGRSEVEARGSRKSVENDEACGEMTERGANILRPLHLVFAFEIDI